MKRVFQIISSFDIGGAERVAFNICKSKNPDFEYHIFEVVHSDSNFSSQIIQELQNAGIKIHVSPYKNNKIALSLFWTWFYKPFYQLQPDIIHAHTEVPDLALWIFRPLSYFLKNKSVKYVRTIHSTKLWDKWECIGRRVEPYYIKHNCNIAISESTRQCYKKAYNTEVSYIIHNGLNEIEQVQFPNISKNKINILIAGRQEPAKGIDVMIKVVKSLATDKDFQFYIIGTGSMNKLIHHELDKQENVTLYDKIYGLSQYLSSFDFLFMPSLFEGLALMPIEAAFAKTPTIINKCPGLKDTLPSDWELAVNNNSIKDFLRLFQLIKEKGQNYQNHLGEIAYQYVNNHFTMEKMQNGYEKLYYSL